MNLNDGRLQTATATALFGAGGCGAARVRGGIFCVFLLRLDLLEGDIREGEVLLRGRETDCRREDVLLSTEFLVQWHCFALEGRAESAEVSELDDVAFRNDVFGDSGSIVQYCCHFLLVESGGLGHACTEAAESDPLATRRHCNLHPVPLAVFAEEIALG